MRRSSSDNPPTASGIGSQEPTAWRGAFHDRALFPPLLVLMMLLVVLMIKTAWIGDDAFISFRPLDNLLNGHGLRWNVAERVQVYTDPAWLMLVLLFYSITHEIFLTVIVLSMSVSFAAVFLLVRYVSSSYAAAVAVLCALISSKAFIDYTTSGLENALGYLLAAAFCVGLFRQQPEFEKFRWLGLIGALAAFNRLDAALLFAPPIAYAGWKSWRVEKVSLPKLLRRGVIYSLPVWGWILFSLIYFGFAFPNTYYAKLHTGVPAGELFTQGILYYFNSVDNDPVTLIALGFALALAFGSRDPRILTAAVGIVLYLLYVVKIGGDFMSGRFFSVPLVLALGLLIHMKLRPVVWLALAVSFLGLGLLPRFPNLLSNETYGFGRAWEFNTDLIPNSVIDPRGIADERAAYYQGAGLLPVLRHDRYVPTYHWARLGQAARQRGRHMVVFPWPGFYGFYAGPEVHIVDTYALGDPLLSKLPVSLTSKWRIGHFERGVPAGYIETLQTGKNSLKDPKIAELYRSIRILTRDPVWGGRRFKEIAKMNLGFYNETMRSIVLPPEQVTPPAAQTRYTWPLPGQSAQTGPVDGSISAGWDREKDAAGDFWWCDKSAQITFPLPIRSKRQAAIIIPVYSYGRDVRLEFKVNGNQASAEPIAPTVGSLFVPMRVEGTWKVGRNVVEVIGSGEPLQPEGDSRRLLFAIRQPLWE